MSECFQDRKAVPDIPLIGVTTALADRTKAASLTRNGELLYGATSYFRCIERAGGCPLAIPCLEDDRFPGIWAERLDGL
ncbi:MAG: gamma-glutamyl-gamma-aminobutyrate hydrolase family protein, partial [bacterium]|nr:gamma-glutamyl-gamma-aminobutyrate hydrolase family protein [bacterium]